MGILEDIGQGASDLWKNIGEGVHTGLDVAGFIPVFGAIADGANAAIYAAEGNGTMAAISAACAVPFIGDAAGAVKVGVKGVTSVAELGTKTLAKTALKEGGEAVAKKGIAETLKGGVKTFGEFTKAVATEQKSWGTLGKMFSSGAKMSTKGQTVARGLLRYGPLTGMILGKPAIEGFEEAYAAEMGEAGIDEQTIKDGELEMNEQLNEVDAYTQQLLQSNGQKIDELQGTELYGQGQLGYNNQSQLYPGAEVNSTPDVYTQQMNQVFDDMATQFGMDSNSGMVSSLKSVFVPMGAQLMKMVDQMKQTFGIGSAQTGVDTLQYDGQAPQLDGLTYDGQYPQYVEPLAYTKQHGLEDYSTGTPGLENYGKEVQRERVDTSLLPDQNTSSSYDMSMGQ